MLKDMAKNAILHALAVIAVALFGKVREPVAAGAARCLVANKFAAPKSRVTRSIRVCYEYDEDDCREYGESFNATTLPRIPSEGWEGIFMVKDLHFAKCSA